MTSLIINEYVCGQCTYVSPKNTAACGTGGLTLDGRRRRLSCFTESKAIVARLFAAGKEPGNLVVILDSSLFTVTRRTQNRLLYDLSGVFSSYFNYYYKMIIHVKETQQNESLHKKKESSEAACTWRYIN